MAKFASPGDKLWGIWGHPLHLPQTMLFVMQWMVWSFTITVIVIVIILSGVITGEDTSKCLSAIPWCESLTNSEGADQKWHSLILHFLCKESMSAFVCYLTQLWWHVGSNSCEITWTKSWWRFYFWHFVSFEHIGVYDWWPGGASDAGAIHQETISAFKQGNSFALLQKKYTKIYILHGQLGNIMQLSLRLRNRFLSSSLPGLVVIFWIPGFAFLAEIQVGNELFACGLKWKYVVYRELPSVSDFQI